MGARMRELDWSSRVLGPLEQWPQSLRACVRVMLGSGYGFSWLGKSLPCGVFQAFLPFPVLAQCSRSDNLRQSRQFLVGAVVGD
jgi:hypothetical protein